MQLILEIDTSNNKAQEFISLIKTLDFVKVNDERADEFLLNDSHKTILLNRKESHRNGKSESYSWEDVKNSLISKLWKLSSSEKSTTLNLFRHQMRK